MGWGLAERVLEIANERPFLPARARAQFADLAGDLQARQSALASVQAGLGLLNVAPAEHDDGSWELGILLPDRLIKGDLENVIEELKAWGRSLKDLLPLFSEGPVTISLRTNSTERFELAMSLDRDRALALGVVIACIYETFKEVRVNRRRAEDLERQGYPSEIVSRLSGYEQQIVSEQLDGLKAKLVQHHVRRGAGKRREIERRLDQGLRFIAARVREGVDLEIVGPSSADAAIDAGSEPVTHHVRAALHAARRAEPAVRTEAQETEEDQAPRLPLSKIAEGAGDREEKRAA
jgi:hypothetical protein